MSAESAGPGMGARFYLRLPLADAALQGVSVPHAETAAGGSSVARTRCRKVLVIDDNADTAETLKEALELAGHEVEVARDGIEGVHKAERFNPHAIVCDIGLPELDGYEVARRLRRSPTGASAFLVALTGYALPHVRLRAKEAGFDRHLSKPPDLALINQLLAVSCC